MSNPEKRSPDELSEIRTFRIFAFITDTFVVSIIPMLICAAMAVPLGRPVYEGLIVGFIAGLAFSIACLMNPEVREQWLVDTEENWEKAEEELEEKWKEEQKRPDDEYTGW